LANRTPAIGCVVDGCPPGMALAEADIQHISTAASPAPRATSPSAVNPTPWKSSRLTKQTTGTPIALLIRNEDQRSKDYGNIADTFRLATPTTPTRRNTASATRAAADAHRPPDRAHRRRRRHRQEVAGRKIRHHRARLHERARPGRHSLRVVG